MTILFFLLFLLLVLVWLLIAPVTFSIDTRTPCVALNYRTVGNATLWFNEEWLLRIKILFYKKVIRLETLKSKSRKNKKKKGKTRGKFTLAKILWVMKTFRLVEWKLAIDTGDFTEDAWLYPLNFSTALGDKVRINFTDENFLCLKIRNRPWKILYAFFAMKIFLII